MDSPGPTPAPSEPPPPLPEPSQPPPTQWQRLRRALLGDKKDVLDPALFHTMSLVAFLAWVGLGADGLSSSAYGPEEAFKNLGEHRYLAVFLALATGLTVLIISAAYSKIIEHFPFGGGGYVVATRLLGPMAGAVSGSALLVDYILTITTSIAAGGDAVFSFLPESARHLMLPSEVAVILALTLMNIRGVKESVKALVPIFLTFIATHAILIAGSVFLHLGNVGKVAHDVSSGLSHDLGTMGFVALMTLFLRAYSLGAGTYTGIEAVSNGLSIMREPRVLTGKRTMVYMAVSLAVTAGGIILGYLLMQVSHKDGQTMNYTLAMQLAGDFQLGPFHVGKWFVLLTILSEALLLFVAAQAGFIDGPRVMANMGHDSWLPHRFSALSDRLTMQNGVLLMGGTSIIMLFITQGSVDALVVLYAINVFVTFSLSQAGMIRFFLQKETQKKHPDWKKQIRIHVIAFALCFGILVVNVFEKFFEGAWITVFVTGGLVGICVLIRRHYESVAERLRRLDSIRDSLPTEMPAKELVLEKKKATAVLLVGGFSGLGIHSLLTVLRLFPRHFHNVVFMSVGVVDSATFQGVEEVERVKKQTEESLKQYVALAQRIGVPAEYRIEMGTEAISGCVKLATEIAKDYPRAIYFAGKLIFEREQWFDRFLHNETAYQIQRRLQFAGLAMVILPVRVLE
ncbi:MAG: APC family permease [Deltaproteobacteria bacterium]|nr:APC family permease [Deltaproteobacteria bacterium]